MGKQLQHNRLMQGTKRKYTDIEKATGQAVALNENVGIALLKKQQEERQQKAAIRAKPETALTAILFQERTPPPENAPQQLDLF